MLNRSTMFRSAWHTARHIAVIEGIALRKAFATALRRAWDAHRADEARRAEMRAETAAIIAQLTAARASRPAHRFAPWQYANAHPRGGM